MALASLSDPRHPWRGSHRRLLANGHPWPARRRRRLQEPSAHALAQSVIRGSAPCTGRLQGLFARALALWVVRPVSECAFPPVGRPHRENVGIDPVNRAPYSARSRGGPVSRSGMSSSFNLETVKRRPNEGTWRRRFHSSTPRITARGRPCRVMTDDSPFAAPSTNADSLAFASRN